MRCSRSATRPVLPISREPCGSTGSRSFRPGAPPSCLRDAGIEVTDVAEITGMPEMMDGRVKTLHPKIHGGLLAVRGNAAHEKALSDHAIPAIDLLAVNLYPFEKTVAGGADFDTCIENIDIGGPALIRAAAKNHASRHGRGRPCRLRRPCWPRWTKMAARRRRLYANRSRPTPSPARPPMTRRSPRGSPGSSARGRRRRVRSPERSPRRSATARTRINGRPSTGQASGASASPPRAQVQGKELSYNNLNDTDAAYELVAEFDPKRCGRRRHHQARQSVRGGARRKTLAEAYRKALACDPVSAFGGIVALNRDLDAEAAREIVKIFTEVIIAPDASDEATAIIAEKKNSAAASRRRASRSDSAKVSPSGRSRAASSCSRATMAWWLSSRW